MKIPGQISVQINSQWFNDAVEHAKTPFRRAAQVNPQFGKWLPWAGIAGLLLLSVSTAYLLFRPLTVPVQEMQSSDSAEVKTDITSEIEKSLQQWVSFQALKTYYSKDSEEIASSVMAEVLRGVPAKTALAEYSHLVIAVRRREAKYVSTASVDKMREALRARLMVMSHVKSTEGPRACNELAINGLGGLQRYLGDGYSEDQELVQLADQMTAKLFEAAAEGRRVQFQYEPLDSAGWKRIADYLVSKGMTEKDFEIFADPRGSLNNPGSCDAFFRFIDAATATKNDVTTLVIPSMTEATASEE